MTEYVKKNAWWYAVCKKHGKQPHLGVLDGRCEKCQSEKVDQLPRRTYSRS